MITKKTVYVSEDGTEFKTHHEAASHDALVKRSARLKEWLHEHMIGEETSKILCAHVDELKAVVTGTKIHKPTPGKWVPPLKEIPKRQEATMNRYHRNKDEESDGD